MRLEGKTALVTGGGTGIGAAIVRRFAAEGATVWAMGRRREQLERGGGGPIAGDVADPDDRGRALDATGPLDVLVNNAGLGDADWDATLAVNLTAAHGWLSGRRRARRSAAGAIVNVSSVAALVAGPGEPQYAVSKAALVMLTKSLAVTLGPRRRARERDLPRLGAHADGRHRDGGARDGHRGGLPRGRRAHVPLRRPAQPDEVAAAALFLASAEASYVSGAVLTVDGGMTAVDVGSLASADPPRGLTPWRVSRRG